MNTPSRLAAPILALATTVTLLGPAAAAPPDGDVDVEVDPIAYALDGYSLHAGVRHDRWRVDLGAFAIGVPAAIHGNDGFTAGFDGFGAKLQYFPLAAGERLFVGAGAGLARLLVRRDGTQLAERSADLTVGVHVGWRIALPHALYLTPWIGVDRVLTGADDVMLGGDTFARDAWQVFPTVHLGYQFR